MPSPIFTQEKPKNIRPLTAGIKKIFQVIYWQQNKKENEVIDEEAPKIKVSEMISKMAFYYEKVRMAVDYTEESLLRKEAIARILKRKMLIEGSIKLNKNVEDAKQIAQYLIIELIRAGYLPNNQLPEETVDLAAVVIHKYLTLRKDVLLKFVSEGNFFSKDIKRLKKELDIRNDLNSWIIGVVSSELEDFFGHNQINETIVRQMYQFLLNQIKLPSGSQYQADLPVQLYIAIYRQWLKYDDEMLSYLLFRNLNEDWDKANDQQIEIISSKLNRQRQAIFTQLNHPLANRLKSIVKRYGLVFSLIREVIEYNPVEVYEELETDPKGFIRRVKAACLKRYNQARKKLWRSAVRSIIYIFLTKSIFVVALEVPAIRFFNEELNNFALAINITFPALLLFLVVLFTRLPDEKNTTKILTSVEDFVFADHRQPEIIIREPMKRNKVINYIFNFIYIITFFVSFYFVIWILKLWSFSWVSIVIFLFFLTFVSFFAIRVRRNIKELDVVEKKDNFFRFLFDFFSVPIIATGKFLSGKFSKINVIVFILDFIIEAPFKVFVEIAEQWTRYVRERKEEL